MGRRYYGLKALVVAVGIALAILSSTLGAPRLTTSMAHLHYGAAASIEMAAGRAVMAVSHAILALIRSAESIKPTQP